MTSPVRVEGLSKAFAGVPALRDVTLDFRPGEVLALIGENGAGKSTLLKILSGDYVPDAGRPRFAGPADAHRAGVRIASQEPEIVPDVSVAENVAIGALPRRYRRAALERDIGAEIARAGFGAHLRAAALGRTLSPAQRQLVEILRAQRGEVRLLALDEPTSSLSDHEAETLFGLVADLRERGVAVVFVSHRLKEIFRIADRVAVLRDGALVGTRSVAETSERELVRMMVGRDLSDLFGRQPRGTDREVLRLEGVTTDDVRGVDLRVRAGEVVALAGLVGAGRSELARAIVGDVPLHGGRILLDGRELRLRSPRDAVRAGIGLAPEERKAEALLLDRGVRDNVTLAVLDRLTRARVIRRGEERRLAQRFVAQLGVRTPSLEQPVRRLSGGNQQKTVLARWLARRPKLLILDEPTRGIDVGAKAEIAAIVDELAGAGVAVLVISSDLPEVLGLGDRIVVMQHGRVTGELTREEATEERVLELAMADHLSDAA